MRAPWLLLLSACAGPAGITERSYVRPELAGLELSSIDLVVVAKGPPLAQSELLDVAPFETPNRTTPLVVEPAAVEMREQLAAALLSELSGRGFRVHLAGEAEVAPLPPIQTSTAVVSSTTATLAAPGATPRIASQLAQSATLEELRLSSTADAILVVRTVIVDHFYLHEASKTLPQTAGDTGPQQQIAGRSFAVTGRLLIGQAFLFDRKTGVRLWSRQLPDYPEGGKILLNHPLLAYGFVQKDKRALDEDTKARLAAKPFTASMLREFPAAPQRGDDQARVALDAVDVEHELLEETFFDDARVMLELELGYSAEKSGSNLALDGEPLPSVGTGAVSPNGIVRGGLRFGYLTPGRLAFSIAGHVGHAPSSFARSYHRDESFENGGRDRNTSVTIDGVTTFGVEPGLGYLILLSENLMLLPGGSLFLDVWNLDAAPDSVVLERTHFRIGVAVDLDLLMSITPAFFARVGVGARGGYDTSGPGFVGAGLTLGLGLFL